MNLKLEPPEIRVLGALIEKELATPDYYPLTVSALTAACNQKSNRNPVMELNENQVLDVLEALGKLYLVREKGGAGGRVPRYAHKLSGTLTKAFDFSQQERAVLAVLFLRGPQTPGEIRTRTTRLCEFHAIEEVDELLHSLASSDNGPYVVELPREPGRREARYTHLFGGPPEAIASVPVTRAVEPGLDERLVKLEEKVDSLTRELAELREALAARRT